MSAAQPREQNKTASSTSSRTILRRNPKVNAAELKLAHDFEIDWDGTYNFIRWVAMDSSGVWRGYSHKPVLCWNRWKTNHIYCGLGDLRSVDMPFQHTLVKRPTP